MVDINIDLLKAQKSEIDELDEILDSVAGGQSAGKRAVTNKLVTATKENVLDDDENVVQAGWDSIVSQVKAYIAEIEDPDVFAGVFAGVRQNLLNDDDLTKRFDSVLDAKAEEIKAATPNLSEDQIKEISDKRRDGVKRFNQVAELLSLYGFQAEVEAIEKPKRRTGAHGKRGPRAISLYTWSVDGNRMPPKEDTLAGVAAQEGYESAKELRSALNDFLGTLPVEDKAPKFSVKNPPEEITFTLENGKTLVGVKSAQASPQPDDDDDDDEDDAEDSTED